MEKPPNSRQSPSPESPGPDLEALSTRTPTRRVKSSRWMQSMCVGNHYREVFPCQAHASKNPAKGVKSRWLGRRIPEAAASAECGLTRVCPANRGSQIGRMDLPAAGRPADCSLPYRRADDRRRQDSRRRPTPICGVSGGPADWWRGRPGAHGAGTLADRGAAGADLVLPTDCSRGPPDIDRKRRGGARCARLR